MHSYTSHNIVNVRINIENEMIDFIVVRVKNSAYKRQLFKTKAANKEKEKK